MSSSRQRLEAAAHDLGIEITIIEMPSSTRTADEAAAACGCDVAQIVKSLVFQGTNTGSLKLFLVSGAHQLDMACARKAAGEPLKRADPRRVRQETGFAIGGIAPIGHLKPIAAWMDEHLLQFDIVWAAAGAPNAVFCAAPGALSKAAGAIAIGCGVD